jgi:prephenate dehydrogenase
VSADAASPDRIALIGVGLMGGSLGLAARERAGVAEVRGFSKSQATMDAAQELGAVTRACSSLEDAVAGADLVFVCTPVRTVVDHVKAVLAVTPASTVVSDVGSTKGLLMHSLGAEQQRRCIGGHPLCGSETAGVANARSSLFEGATYFLTPGAHVDAEAYQRLYGFLGEIGARPVAVDPGEHDRLMAVMSHLPHVLANVLMVQAGKHAGTRDALLSAGPSFRDLTRVAGSNRQVWTDIFMDNRAALLAAMATFQEGLQEVLQALAANDAARLEGTIARAAAQRERMLAGEDLRPGELRRLIVQVPDRPGSFKDIFVALGDAAINIEDTSFHHKSVELGGTLTVYVMGDDVAARAVHILAGLGYDVITGTAVA